MLCVDELFVSVTVSCDAGISCRAQELYCGLRLLSRETEGSVHEPGMYHAYMCLLVFGKILADPDPYPFLLNAMINYTFSRKFQFSVQNIIHFDTCDDEAKFLIYQHVKFFGVGSDPDLEWHKMESRIRIQIGISMTPIHKASSNECF